MNSIYRPISKLLFLIQTRGPHIQEQYIRFTFKHCHYSGWKAFTRLKSCICLSSNTPYSAKCDVCPCTAISSVHLWYQPCFDFTEHPISHREGRVSVDTGQTHVWWVVGGSRCTYYRWQHIPCCVKIFLSSYTLGSRPPLSPAPPAW